MATAPAVSAGAATRATHGAAFVLGQAWHGARPASLHPDGHSYSSCLDGEWIEGNYTVYYEYETTPFTATGGSGARLYISGTGKSRFVATPPISFTGTVHGEQAVITASGQFTFTATFVARGSTGEGTMIFSGSTYSGYKLTATFGGQPVSITQPTGTEGGPYKCSTATLKLLTATGGGDTIVYTRSIGSAVGIAAMPTGGGYWVAHATGRVTAHGSATFWGSMAGSTLVEPISHIVATPDGLGYWLVASDGGTFSFGDAGFFGSMGGKPLNAPVVDIAPTPDGKGYWLVASDGGIFAFGDAKFHGSMGGKHLNEPVVGMSPDYATGGYWEVASDGGIFAFDAPFYGSTGSIHLNKPVVGMTATSDDLGYWFVASDGGLFAYGDAGFHGSMGGKPLNAPIVGMAADTSTGGYWEVASDGGIFAFDAPFYGAG